MRSFWNHLAVRERWFVIIGSALTFLLLLYALLSPFWNALNSLQQEVNSDKELLQWMQPAVQTITALKTRGIPAPEMNNQSLLVILNSSLDEAQLKPFLTQISQNNNTQVSIHFAAVPFDHLIAWLTKIWQRDAIETNQILITPQNTPGLVEANLILQRKMD